MEKFLVIFILFNKALGTAYFPYYHGQLFILLDLPETTFLPDQNLGPFKAFSQSSCGTICKVKSAPCDAFHHDKASKLCRLGRYNESRFDNAVPRLKLGLTTRKFFVPILHSVH